MVVVLTYNVVLNVTQNMASRVTLCRCPSFLHRKSQPAPRTPDHDSMYHWRAMSGCQWVHLLTTNRYRHICGLTPYIRNCPTLVVAAMETWCKRHLRPQCRRKKRYILRFTNTLNRIRWRRPLPLKPLHKVANSWKSISLRQLNELIHAHEHQFTVNCNVCVNGALIACISTVFFFIYFSNTIFLAFSLVLTLCVHSLRILVFCLHSFINYRWYIKNNRLGSPQQLGQTTVVEQHFNCQRP